jgi:hypothetical protein
MIKFLGLAGTAGTELLLEFIKLAGFAGTAPKDVLIVPLMEGKRKP